MSNTKEKTYKIQVPVFSTDMVEDGNVLFGDTYQNLINAVKQKIDKYNGTLSFANRNKTQQTIIKKITYSEHTIGDRPSLLLKISAYSTNLFDGYFEDNERHPFEKENKIGTDNNFVLVYPVMAGLVTHNYTRYFLILVYDDPNKEDSSHLIRITKSIAKDVLETPIKNIKPKTVIEELKEIGRIPEIEVKYYGMYNDENDVDVKYQEYYLGGKIKKHKTQNFRDMPFDSIPDFLEDTTGMDDYQSKTTTLKIGKKEYKITKVLKAKLNDASEQYADTAEKVFNAAIGISQSELESNRIYEPDYIIDKLSGVISNYVSSEINNEY